MPYARKTGLRRKTFRKRRMGAKRSTGLIKKVVNRTLRSHLEVKKLQMVGTEVNVTSISPGTAANWFDPFGSIGQGTGSYQRIGNKIKVIGLSLKNMFNNNSTTQLWCRFAVFRCVDRANISTTSNIFESGTGGNADFSAISGIQGIIRPFNLGNVKPVFQKVFKLSANSGEAANSFTRLNKFIKFPRGLEVRFNSTSTGTTNVFPLYQIGCWIAESPEDLGIGVTCEWSYVNTVYYTDA